MVVHEHVAVFVETNTPESQLTSPAIEFLYPTVPVPDREPDPVEPLTHRQVASLLGHPHRVRVRGDAEDVDSPGPDLNREEHVQGAEPGRLDSEEVQRQDPPGLRPEELAPGGASSPGSRAEPVPSKQRADLRGRDLDAELGELATDPDASPSGFSLPIRRMSSRTSSLIGGLPPPDARRKVHFLRTSSRCQRRMVWGLTTKADQRARGRAVLNAAMNSRSLRRRRGLPTWRLRTINWWRRTTTSTSVVTCTLEDPAINRTRQRSNRYTRAKNTNRTSFEKEGRSYERAGHERRSVVCVPFRLGSFAVEELHGRFAI